MSRPRRTATAAAIRHLRTDPVMAAIIDRAGPCDLVPRRQTPFESLVRAVIHQQLSGSAAGTILRRFEALFGAEGFPQPHAVLQMAPERLRSAGLSGAKTRYILGLAGQADAGTIPTLEGCDALTNEELIERLTALDGIGRWTAEMMLMFNLGRPDVLPVHDLGVRKGFRIAYRKRAMPTPKQLDRFGLRWAPYRTTAAWYLWRATEFPKAAE